MSFHLLFKKILSPNRFFLSFISIHNNTHSQIIVFSLRFSAYSWDIYCRRSQIDISFQLVQSFVSRTLSNVKIFSLLFVYFCKIHVIWTENILWPQHYIYCIYLLYIYTYKLQQHENTCIVQIIIIKRKSQHISQASRMYLYVVVHDVVPRLTNSNIQ